MYCMFTCTVKGQLGLLIGLHSPGVQGEEMDRVIGCHAVLLIQYVDALAAVPLTS